ncbi:unnamed protein product [Effrenium voratum]|uniref:Uncharacterized protein n=1 Tax=Effrenium voratum TaxID=2562239 RepID=A0AA36MYW2_9DINO|nr:unnamed protein product [Effrenium voratum]
MKLKSLVTALALSAAIPASATELNMQNAFPAGLPIVGTGADRFADLVETLTGGELSVTVHGPGALSPLPEILENVGSGAIEAGWAYAGFWEGKAPAAGLFGSIPFGPDAMKYLAWTMEGGGLEIWREVYEPFNVVPFPCGAIIAEAGGWYTKEINTAEDFAGVNFRIGGLGGRILGKLGANPVLLPVGEVTTALQTGRLDGVEISAPWVDRNLGFNTVANNYYFPGWHQPAGFTELIINKDVWDAMSTQEQAAVETACAEINIWAIGIASAAQADALAFLRGEGVNVQRFPDEVLAALRDATEEVFTEQSAADPMFKRALESYQAFSDKYDEYQSLSALD